MKSKEQVKISTEKFELMTGTGKDEEATKKTRSFHYWRNNGRVIAISPSLHAFWFVNDKFIKRHGITLKCAKLPFVHLDREVSYLEMCPQLFFTKNLGQTWRLNTSKPQTR